MTTTSPWLRLDADTFDDESLAEQPALFQLVWVRLLCTAKRHGPGGVLRRRLATPEGLATLWGTDGLDADTIRNALGALQESGLLRCGSDRVIVTRWSRYQRDPTGHLRVTRHRRKSTESGPNVNGLVTRRNALTGTGTGTGTIRSDPLVAEGTERPERQPSLLTTEPPRDDPAERVLRALNAATGRTGASAYRGDHALTLIRQRLAEHPEPALLAMIADRVQRWAGRPDMQEYLRPSTLFAPRKCSEYVAQAAARPAAQPERPGCKSCGRPILGAARQVQGGAVCAPRCPTSPPL